VHSQLASPVAVGILRRTIVMPVAALEWPQSLQQAALAHEIAHVRRHDCATQLFAQIVRAIFWFNPFVWLAERAMRRERELACDAFAVAGGLKASAYAEWLLSLHVSPPRALIASMEGGGLHQRIAHLLTPRRRLPRTLEVAALTSFLAVALILGCGKRAPTFAVTTEPITPVASMDPALIKGAIREHRDEFRACYENELAHTPTLGGTIKTQFIIGNDGAVTSSAISDSSMGSAAVEGCIAQVESRILFPKPKGNGSITVNYPFAFAPY